MFEPAAYRAAYGLRTALLKSYSARMSSDPFAGRRRAARGDLSEVFFIFALLTRRCQARADNTNQFIATVGEQDRK